ncbi:hypothetical protein KY49_2801 [Burkholderia sp. MSHR3999]|uniref:hypothetical protein n=1 Tax=Burkholderia sp. MSHR3999 TaxID=1542965 RepID=UPI0005ABE50F|nr:hypothetical protein [Burkholderia sp. MSHR3999]KIP18170.1 hypothetical protein KY49_2801 [Burkholderia sp. MSHR3999]
MGLAEVLLASGKTHDRALLDQAKRRLESFAFFGITKRMRDSMSLLAHARGFFPNFSVPRLNASSNRSGAAELSAGELDAIHKLIVLDRELYVWACQLLEERIGEMLRSLLRGRYQQSEMLIKRSWHEPIAEQAKADIELTMLRAPSQAVTNKPFSVEIGLCNRSRTSRTKLPIVCRIRCLSRITGSTERGRRSRCERT